MATKSQRKKEQQRKKRKQKKAQQQVRREKLQQQNRVPGSNVRHRQRLAQQTPRAWDGEPPEDVAVFEDSAFESLSPELAGQVSAVREALQYACESGGEEALKRISGISRSSPLSEWRLFIRGLVQWLADDIDGANEAWQRLNPERRAGRVAIAMMTALRSDLERVSTEKPTEKSTENTNRETSDDATGDWLDRLDDQLLYHAKLLRRVRFDRAAIRVAEAGVRVPEESQDLQLGPKKLKWLQEFAAEYRATEPDLVAALEKIALGRAFVQNYGNLFESAVKAFVGPRHDRKNRLLAFFYYMQFANDSSAERRAERSLDEYLTKDLPQNQELSEPLRQAIASQIHLNEAMMLIQPDGEGMTFFMFQAPEDPKVISKKLQESVRSYPANRGAYKAHVGWLESQLENDRLTKPKREPLIKQLAQVMQNWSRGLPDDVEPRLWLVDHLLENEQTEDAKPHVDWLAASRQDDPRVRAAPWKWQLLEAMRLSRRKAWLSEIPGRLEEAESKWPSWLSKQWLPYLKAAWMLRCGKSEEFEEQRQQLCSASGVARDSPADACMMLGAAQRLRVPAEDLKPLREPVDAAVKNIRQLPLDELLFASGFFWDLHRTQLLYPAYRLHGGKFAKEMFARLSARPKLVLDRIDDGQLHAAVLWSSEYRFWSEGSQLSLPSWYSKPVVEQHPMFAAAKLNAFLKLRSHWRSDRYKQLGPFLREAAQSQRDPYYRYWFISLADELDDVVARNASNPFGFAFSRMFGRDDPDEDDPDEDDPDEDDLDEDDLGFDPDCDCPACRAAKQAYEASR